VCHLDLAVTDRETLVRIAHDLLAVDQTRRVGLLAVVQHAALMHQPQQRMYVDGVVGRNPRTA